MTEKQYYLLKKCSHCKNYNEKIIEKNVYGKDKRFPISKRCNTIFLCDLYGNVNPNDCCDEFTPKKQVIKECETYGAVLLSKEELKGDV